MNLDILYSKTYNPKYTGKPARFIQRYEDNKERIEGAECGGEYDCLYKKMRLASDYAHFLFKVERYNKTIEAAQYALGLYESHPEHTQTNLIGQDYYKLLLFEQGVAYYHAGEKRKAAKNFDRLVERFPENESYRTWLIESQSNHYRSIENVFLIMLVLGLAGDVFLRGSLPEPWSYVVTGMLVIGFIGVATIRLLLYLKKKSPAIPEI